MVATIYTDDVPMKAALKWLSRATGIGYHPPLPLADDPVRKTALAMAADLRERSEELVKQAQRLESILRDGRPSSTPF